MATAWPSASMTRAIRRRLTGPGSWISPPKSSRRRPGRRRAEAGKVLASDKHSVGEIAMRLAVLAAASGFFATSVLAQPLPTPPSFPPVVAQTGVIATHELSLDMAEKIAPAGVVACRKMGFHTTMVVVDSSGTMKAFLRDDQTGPHTINLAQDKAYTALTLANRFASSLTFANARGGTLG